MRPGSRRWVATLAVPALALGWATTAATPAAAESVSGSACAVEDATITWGFKESFRSYISGAIANGDWTVSGGAEYETPDFTFVGGSGQLDRADRVGAVEFPGAITFTGHGDILNTTVENPVIEFRGDAASVHFDVHGTTQDGTEVDEQAVEFVSLELDRAEEIDRTDRALTVTAIPATLTDAGAQAFGTYQAGEPFDPVTIELTFGSECEAPAAAPNWWLLGGIGAAAAVALGATLIWVRGRRQR